MASLREILAIRRDLRQQAEEMWWLDGVQDEDALRESLTSYAKERYGISPAMIALIIQVIQMILAIWGPKNS